MCHGIYCQESQRAIELERAAEQQDLVILTLTRKLQSVEEVG